MIASIVLTDRHKVRVSSNNKIKVGDIVLNTNEVPFVRYRFNSYSESDIGYINGIKSSMKYSTQLAEVNVSEDAIKQIETIKDGVNNIAIFLYFDVSDNEVLNKAVDEKKAKLIEEIVDNVDVDSIILRDKSSNMDTVASNYIIEQISKKTGFEKDKFGICSSPLSFGDKACLTAVKAREIMAEYSEVDNVPLPTANHQKGCCGCIQYLLVDSDTELVAEKVNNRKTKEENGTPSNSTKKSSKNKVLSLGKFKF